MLSQHVRCASSGGGVRHQQQYENHQDSHGGRDEEMLPFSWFEQVHPIHECQPKKQSNNIGLSMTSLSSMDISLSIPTAPAASMLADKESMSDDKISIFIPQRSSPSTPNNNKILPLGFQQDDDPPPVLSAKSMTLALIKKVMAEFLGTFLLIFIVVSALIMNETHNGALGLLGVAATAGTAIVVIVSSIFHVSGAQLNPAVAITMAVFGHMPRAHLLPYIVAQLLGSTVASFVAKAIYDPVNLGAIVATVPRIGTFEAFWIEFITTFILLFVITSLSTDPRAVKELIAVGAAAAVMLSTFISAESTGASMNPARTLGTAIATGTYTKVWIYIVAPPLGAIAGCGAYHALK